MAPEISQSEPGPLDDLSVYVTRNGGWEGIWVAGYMPTAIQLRRYGDGDFFWC